MRMGNFEKKCYILKFINVDIGIMRLVNMYDLNLLYCFCINVVNLKIQIEKLLNLLWK